MGDMSVTVTSAEIKNGRLTIKLSLGNYSGDLIWKDVYFYYNGDSWNHGTLIDTKNVVMMPYADKTVTLSCKVGSGFGRGSLDSIVLADEYGDKVVLTHG